MKLVPFLLPICLSLALPGELYLYGDIRHPCGIGIRALERPDKYSDYVSRVLYEVVPSDKLALQEKALLGKFKDIFSRLGELSEKTKRKLYISFWNRFNFTRIEDYRLFPVDAILDASEEARVLQHYSNCFGALEEHIAYLVDEVKKTETKSFWAELKSLVNSD